MSSSGRKVCIGRSVCVFVARVIMTEECRKSPFMCNYDDIGEFERDFVGLTTEVSKLI